MMRRRNERGILSSFFFFLSYMIFIYFLTDIDECKTNPCQNGGKCQNTEGSYMCQCTDGWTGQRCGKG